MTAAYQEISATEASARLAEFRLVDVREPRERNDELGHIVGSESVPVGEIQTLAQVGDDKRPILLICRSGKRSVKACKLLLERGVGDPVNLVGGMLEWDRQGLPVECQD